MEKRVIFEDVYSNYIVFLSNRLKPTTLLNVKRCFNKHILPFFKNKDIYDLDQNDFLNWQEHIKKLDLSDSFNTNTQAIFRKFYDYLEKIYSIKNFAKIYGNFKTFKPKNEKKLDVWSMKEYRKFIKCVDDQVYHALFNLLFFSGLRKGEALALRFNDLSKDYISVTKSISKELFNKKHLEMTPKTKKSVRKVRIDRKLYHEIKKLQDYYKLKYKNFNENFYIFGGIKTISQTTLKRKKDEWCKRANVKQIRIHDFRHSHATILYHKNIKIKAIQDRLGHSDISTTLNTYVHTNEKDEKRVLRTLNFLHFRF